ncbi:hypothetical protein KDA11_02960 [Candidatus Saccharibacteria bacterium]|nr:hypothetical protein [Candidatus Saccharibacteria bacterium]
MTAVALDQLAPDSLTDCLAVDYSYLNPDKVLEAVNESLINNNEEPMEKVASAAKSVAQMILNQGEVSQEVLKLSGLDNLKEQDKLSNQNKHSLVDDYINEADTLLSELFSETEVNDDESIDCVIELLSTSLIDTLTKYAFTTSSVKKAREHYIEQRVQNNRRTLAAAKFILSIGDIDWITDTEEPVELSLNRTGSGRLFYFGNVIERATTTQKIFEKLAIEDRKKIIQSTILSTSAAVDSGSSNEPEFSKGTINNEGSYNRVGISAVYKARRPGGDDYRSLLVRLPNQEVNDYENDGILIVPAFLIIAAYKKSYELGKPSRIYDKLLGGKAN